MEIEICCGSVQSAMNALNAGATRIELCQNLNEGGTTPSYATIKQCIEMGLNVYVLVRPRPGNFVYNDLEISNMLEDVKICKELGVAGIVVGFLNEDDSVNTELTQRFVEESAPIPVTFHRAFDRCNDWTCALEEIIQCGCKRILTSGCKPTAMEGKETLREIISQAGDRITILIGSGIRPSNIRELVEYTGAKEAHGSCKVPLPDGYDETDEQQVCELLKQVSDK